MYDASLDQWVFFCGKLALFKAFILKKHDVYAFKPKKKVKQDHKQQQLDV